MNMSGSKGPDSLSLTFFLLHILVAVLFLKGFLLTRIELPDISNQLSSDGNQSVAYSKAVIIIVDAVRFDFLCTPPNGSSNHLAVGLLPKMLGLVKAAVGADQWIGLHSCFAHGLPAVKLTHQLLPCGCACRQVLQSFPGS
jgi:hypothetical protein